MSAPADLFAPEAPPPPPPPPPAPEPAAPPPCADCQAWERNPIHGGYSKSCDGCTARDIARGPRAWASVCKGDKEPLRLEIQHRFGDRALTVGRKLVWDWCQRLQIGGPR